uniref:Rab-GAP TBC domain-containing protein n=1 Tax=Schistosoma curassoni TaxID=6186 RepID=A0A183KW04_9TREM
LRSLSYYPTHLYIYDPHVILPYPTFDKNGQLIAEKPLNQTNLTTTMTVSNDNSNNIASSKQPSWLSHFIIDDDENDNRQQTACLLAKKLCSPLSETREFWTSLAKQLLYMHRSHFDKQGYYTFITHYLIRSCLLAFGPKNMLEHLEYFMKTLLITLPNSKLPLDGKAEFIGFYWIQVVLSDIVNISSLWSRQWKYYFWGCFIPRILCWSEICALNVSVNDLAQSVDEKLHPAVRHVQWTMPIYAGRFAGGRDDDDITDALNYQLFIRNLFKIDDPLELLGGEFLFKSFLPLLVRDTLNVLRLKRKKLSESSLMLSVAPPEQINSTIIQEIYKNMNTIEVTTDNNNHDDNNNSNVILNNYRLAEIIVLSNRLYCLFSCLRLLLNYSCPTFIPSLS